MSKGLIAAWGFYRTDTPLDFEAGKAVNLTEEETDDFWEQTTGGENEDAEVTRTRVETYLDVLAEGADLDIELPGGWSLFLCGGDSYGDDPTETFTAMSNLQAVPRVLRACGFERA